MPYAWWSEEEDDMPRNLTAVGMGVGTGLLGNIVPIVGITAGLILQIYQDRLGIPKPHTYIIEGVVDGSAALLGRAIIRL